MLFAKIQSTYHRLLTLKLLKKLMIIIVITIPTVNNQILKLKHK